MTLFSLLFQRDVRVSKNKKVIRAKDFSTLVTARDILEKAKQDAEAYQKESEEMRRKTLEEAKKQGEEAGLEKFSESIVRLEQDLKKLRVDVMQAVLPIALKAAKKIVGKELEQFPETIVDIVLQTIAPFTQSQRVTIYVSKADKDLLEQNRPKLKEILSQAHILNVLEREDIAPGGCIIETETGIINASIDNQWRALEAAFERYKTS
jgi:type III secretion protein L